MSGTLARHAFDSQRIALTFSENAAERHVRLRDDQTGDGGFDREWDQLERSFLAIRAAQQCGEHQSRSSERKSRDAPVPLENAAMVIEWVQDSAFVFESLSGGRRQRQEAGAFWIRRQPPEPLQELLVERLQVHWNIQESRRRRLGFVG